MIVLPEFLYKGKLSFIYTYVFSLSTFEVSVKLTMAKKQSTLPSNGGLKVSLHMLKGSSDSWRGHCK